MIDMACFLLSALLYAFSTLADPAHWLSGSRRGIRLDQPSLVAATILHGVAIALRRVAAGYTPLSNGFESFTLVPGTMPIGQIGGQPGGWWPALHLY